MSAIRKAGEKRFRAVSEEIRALEKLREGVIGRLAHIHNEIEKYRDEHRALSSELFNINTSDAPDCKEQQ